MHVEPPEGRLRSLKEFLTHYLMIVLSILTALGLEEAVLHFHHAAAGREALERIDREIQANLKDVRATEAENDRRAAPVIKLSADIAAALRAGKPDAAIREEIIAPGIKAVQIGVAWVIMRHSAWDVAVADQSVGHIDAGRLGALSELYSMQREFLSGEQSTTVFLNGSGLADIFTDIQVGDESPRELLHSLRQLTMTNSATQNNLRTIEAYLEAGAGNSRPLGRIQGTDKAASASAPNE
jgi:hypothetical protein